MPLVTISGVLLIAGALPDRYNRFIDRSVRK